MLPRVETGGGARRRLSVALVAYACLLGQLSAFAHRALVQHVTCAEHGDAVHVGAAGPGDDQTPTALSFAAARTSGPEPAQATPAPVVTADEHDHCSVVLSRTLAPASHAQAGAAPLLAAAGCDRSNRFIAPAGAATYLIAPKTSPPRNA